MEKLIKTQEMARQNQEASIKNFERHMGQMAKQIVEMGKKQAKAFPCATEGLRDKGKATKWE